MPYFYSADIYFLWAVDMQNKKKKKKKMMVMHYTNCYTKFHTYTHPILSFNAYALPSNPMTRVVNTCKQ